MPRAALPKHSPCRLPAILVALVLVALAALPSAASARPTMATGLSGLYDFGPDAMRQTQTTGARFLRVVISWRAVAPKNRPASWNPADPGDPAYVWSETDERIRHATEAGFIPFALVTEAPGWAEQCTPETESSVCNPDPSAFATFAHAAAVRYSGKFAGLPRVQYWQPINEPNLSVFFNPQFDGAGKPTSPDLYRSLLNGFSAAVKGVDGSNLIVGGGLGPIAVHRFTIGPMEFARSLLCMTGARSPHKTKGGCEGGVHFDIFDIHPYTTGGPKHKGRGNDVEMGDLGKLQKLLRAAKRDGRIVSSSRNVPLWITEFSWDTSPPDPGGLSMKIESRWIAESMYLSWRAGVSAYFWYSLYDDPPTDGLYANSAQSGLYFAGPSVAENTPKPILYAFRFPLVVYPTKQGLSYWGRTFGGRPGRVAIQVFRQGKWRNLTNARANARGIFAGVVKSSYGRDKNGAVRARLGGELSVPFSMRPVKEFIQPPFG
jgi:hypothetical protein